ncbi:MAG: hypothetical protein ACM34O_14490 [Ignavibacteria bacterium]
MKIIHGEIFSKDEGEKFFGPANISISLSAAELEQLLDKTGDTLLIKIIGEDLFILDNKKNLLFKTGGDLPGNEQLFVYSVSVIKTLIEKGRDEWIFFEQRKDILSVSNGNFIMERGSSCPPFC